MDACCGRTGRAGRRTSCAIAPRQRILKFLQPACSHPVYGGGRRAALLALYGARIFLPPASGTIAWIAADTWRATPRRSRLHRNSRPLLYTLSCRQRQHSDSTDGCRLRTSRAGGTSYNSFTSGWRAAGRRIVEHRLYLRHGKL